ncbi:MAG TPA: FkbM family methyltransferase [Solirubrobacteraceae bacterium]|jgi:FkbM family methyltransferase
MFEQLPWRMRIQFALTRGLTRALRALGLREHVIRGRYSVVRARRRAFERLGSERYSRPALHAMDGKLDRIIDLDGGTFVEAGGHDGYTQSNTYYLERFRGWRGVLVEPMPEMARQARLNRPGSRLFQCALVGAEQDGDEIEMEFGDLFTKVRSEGDEDWVRNGLVLGWRDHRVEAVPARSLSSVLAEAGVHQPDLLSLDVEGYEEQVLGGLDLSRHAPGWILVEMHDLQAGRAAIGRVLGASYVEHTQLSPVDVLYRRSDVTPKPAEGPGAEQRV